MGTLKQDLENRAKQYDHWASRRRYGPEGPNNRRLWVLACMDERLPVDEALGIHVDTPVGGGDAHCFRNAGGIVTDDAIRSAMLTCNFFGTTEIVIVQHTQCGMLSANAADLEAALKKRGVDPDKIALDPSLPELTLAKGAFAKWIGMMDDVDLHDDRQRVQESSADSQGGHRERVDLGGGDASPARADPGSRKACANRRHGGAIRRKGQAAAPLGLTNEHGD